MPLSPGTRLGPYEIVAPLGAGGMGEVYRATDTRLGRHVALKILPAELAQQPERRLRFEREAKTISHLSHPGICTLHDFGHHDGTPYLVMELLESETLAIFWLIENAEDDFPVLDLTPDPSLHLAASVESC